MKTALLTILLACSTLSTFADVSTIIRQKARDVANNPSPNGQPKPPAPGQRPPPTAPKPMPPKLSADQQTFVNDLAVVKTNSTEKLQADLSALAYGARKPGSSTIVKLANDLANALIGHPLPIEQRTRIAQDIQTVFSANLTPAAAENFIIDVPLVLKAAGVEAKWTAAIGDDLRAARKEVIAPPAPVLGK